MNTIPEEYIISRLSLSTLQGCFVNLAKIQLTNGCSNQCSYCYLNTPQLSAQMSFGTVKAIASSLKTYPRSTILAYASSDPFDYQDGDKTFMDCFKVLKEEANIDNLVVNTALPKGKEKQVEEFISDHCLRALGGCKDQFRLSLNEKNEQRMSEVVLTVIERLKTSGLTDREVNTVLGEPIKELLPHLYQPRSQVACRVGVLRMNPIIANKAGRLFNWPDRDRLNSLATVECKDGVVITPFGFYGLASVAVTSKHQSGVWQWKITGENQKIPVYFDTGQCAYSYSIFEPNQRFEADNIARHFMMLPPVRGVDGYEGNRKVAFLHNLYRDILSYSLFLNKHLFFNKTDKLKQYFDGWDYFHSFKEEYLKRKKISLALAEKEEDKEAKEILNILLERLDNLLS